MKLRLPISALLVILLLCGSSWAAACDLSCSLHHAVATCHPASLATTTMPAGHCHGMAAMQPIPSDILSATCTAGQCSHTTVTADRLTEDPFSHIGTTSLLAVSGVLPGAIALSRPAILPAIPRGHPSGVVPRLISLRV